MNHSFWFNFKLKSLYKRNFSNYLDITLVIAIKKMRQGSNTLPKNSLCQKNFLFQLYLKTVKSKSCVISLICNKCGGWCDAMFLKGTQIFTCSIPRKVYIWRKYIWELCSALSNEKHIFLLSDLRKKSKILKRLSSKSQPTKRQF